jgi:hypothetical protein
MELKLVEFRVLYRTWKRGVPWIDHLLLGLLVWLEEKLIDARVKVEVDEAIREYETLQGALARTHEVPMPDMVTPIYTEKPSDTSTSLPEMRLTAPWYKETKV